MLSMFIPVLCFFVLPALGLLAQAAPADNSGTIITGFVVAVIGAIGAAAANVMGRRSGRAEVTIGNNPLGVRVEDHFVSRREFDELKIQVAGNMQKVEGLFAQTMQAVKDGTAATDRRIENQNKRLGDTIEKVAKAAYDGRGKIWNKVNDQAEKMAVLQERCDVADGMKNLGEVIAGAIVKSHGE
jgi:hypothetical protein